METEIFKTQKGQNWSSGAAPLELVEAEDIDQNLNFVTRFIHKMATIFQFLKLTTASKFQVKYVKP